MFSTITKSVHAYVSTLVQQTLSKISAPVRIVSRIKGDDEIIYDEATSKHEPCTTIYVNHPNFWMRILSDFDLGFAEAYMLQEIDCDNLSKIFELYIHNFRTIESGNFLWYWVPRLATWWRPRNDLDTARLNIASHYNTSNGLFSRFLSSDMNYSCAHWSGDAQESLESAQKRKVRYMIKKARLSCGNHLLDIGCGWGDLIIEAAQLTGCQATGLTLSEHQKTLADQRIEAAGLQDQVRVLLCDYRNAPRPDKGYDQIISVGMFEHVGPQFIDGYFEKISSLLNEEKGVMIVDGITKINSFHETNPYVGEYINNYVFPGGYLPTANILLEAMHRGSKGALEVFSVLSTGPHYGKTLVAWKDNFLQNWNDIEFDFMERNPKASKADVEAFRRRWLYYFDYCEAGFRSRILENHLICAVRTPEAAYPRGVVGMQFSSVE